MVVVILTMFTNTIVTIVIKDFQNHKRFINVSFAIVIMFAKIVTHR